MPIYEYRCSSCGHELEALQKFSDAPLATCPSCHADTLGQAGLRRRLPVEGQRLVRHGLQAERRETRRGEARWRRRGRDGDRATDAAAKGDSKGDAARASPTSDDEERGQADLEQRRRAGRQDRSHSCRHVAPRPAVR